MYLERDQRLGSHLSVHGLGKVSMAGRSVGRDLLVCSIKCGGGRWSTVVVERELEGPSLLGCTST